MTVAEDLLDAARQAVAENLRHSHDSLFELLGRWFPKCSDDEIEAAVEAVL